MSLTDFFGSYQGDVITSPSGVYLNVITSITTTSAVLGGRIENGDGNLPIIRNGVCINTTGILNDLSSDFYNMPICHITTGVTCYFSMNVTYLTPNTTYYVQAYAENEKGINFSSQGTFTTLGAVVLPAVSLSPVITITSNTAYSGGNVINQGSSNVTVRGVCWGTAMNPTIAKPLTPTTSGGRTKNGSGLGEFTSYLTGMSGNTLYYIRAYATNGSGTSYSGYNTFTTVGNLPSILTTIISNITINSASSGGNVTSQGSSAITERGICYSTSINPTTSQPTITTNVGGKIINIGTLGSFITNISGLSTGVLYYVRAYAINSYGTSYGVNQSFTTSSSINATVASSLNTEYSNSYSIKWTVTLSSAALNNITIILNITNEDNTGTSEYFVNFTIGQITAFINTINLKQTSDYIAYCNFGIMPNGYVSGNSANYLISKIVTSVPIITTNTISSIVGNTASGGGAISSDGGFTIDHKGIQWSLVSDFSVIEGSTDNGIGIASFTSSLINLKYCTTYYVRSYAHNSLGTGYGTTKTFTASYPISKISINLIHQGSGTYEGTSYNIVVDSLATAESVATKLMLSNGSFTSVSSQVSYVEVLEVGKKIYLFNNSCYPNNLEGYSGYALIENLEDGSYTTVFVDSNGIIQSLTKHDVVISDPVTITYSKQIVSINSISSVEISNDGTHLYILYPSLKIIRNNLLSTPFDIASIVSYNDYDLSVLGVGTVCCALYLSPDNKKLSFADGNYIKTIQLSVANDLTTELSVNTYYVNTSYISSSITSISFDPTGYYCVIIGYMNTGQKRLVVFSSSTPFEISGVVTYMNISTLIMSGHPRGLEWNTDGTSYYSLDDITNNLNRYAIPGTPYIPNALNSPILDSKYIGIPNYAYYDFCFNATFDRMYVIIHNTSGDLGWYVLEYNMV